MSGKGLLGLRFAYKNKTEISMEKSIPAHLCTHELVFSSPNNFPRQALHDKDLNMQRAPYVVAVVVLPMPLSITSCNEKDKQKKGLKP